MTKDTRRRGTLLQRLGLSLLSLLAIVAADRLLKVYYYSKTYRYYEAGEVYVEDENTLLLFSPDRYLFWKIKPRIELKITEDPEEYDLRTIGSRPGHYFFTVRSNAHGLNSPDVSRSKPAGTRRVITLGDSRTMAEGVPFDRLYSRRLEALLHERLPATPVEVINAGVSGYTSYQGLVQLKRNLLAFDPDVVTVLFGINDQDFDLGVSDRHRAEAFDSPMVTVRAWANRSMIYYFMRRQAWQLKGLLFGKTRLGPPGSGAGDEIVRRVSTEEYRANLEEIADFGEIHGFTPVFLILPTSPYAYYPSLFDESLEDVRLAHLAKFQRALQHYEGQDYGTAVELLTEILAERDYAHVRRLLGQSYQQLQRYEEAHEQFVEMNRKIIFQRYAEVVRQVSRERGLPLVDLTPEFTAITPEPLYVDDMHPNPRGQDLIAAKTAEAILSKGLLAP